MSGSFQSLRPAIEGNPHIRTPQREAYAALRTEAANAEGERELGIILPVGCGKSGCIAISPFAFGARRALVIAPGVNIAGQLARDFDPTNAQMFYQKCRILTRPPYPEPVEIRGTTTNQSDLREADVVITNIGQLQGEENRWLQALPADFFDLILFDEGHHSVASTWVALKEKFPAARIVNFSATPLRADGRMMAGRIIYSYPIFRAIQEGYVKRLKAVQLNPRTLRYVRQEGEAEITVALDEVRKLGEEDADFRRSIVTSTETLNTIVDASLRELNALRQAAGENRLKIIASALNYAHCRQIVEAYRARGRRADYVHSMEQGAANRKVLERLEAHELDVIVQVRKLGEGFDHPHLAVAAVFSIFANLSPFVQFVGRIMRVLVQNNPTHRLNQGVVVFHAGANVARQWGDFQSYTEADQEFFDQLLPLEDLDPAQDEREIAPAPRDPSTMQIRGQSDVRLEEIPLLQDTEAMALLRQLQERGYSKEQIGEALNTLEPMPTTRVAERQAKRQSLDMRCRTAAARILAARKVNPGGRDLDPTHQRENLIYVKAMLDKRVNTLVGRKSGARSEFSREDLDKIDQHFDEIEAAVIADVFDGD
jgi:superfamily II DNA or RNA helicase